jgi:hypothetical protein
MAVRDGAPRGVLFVLSADGLCRELAYVEVPEMLTGATVQWPAGSPTTASFTGVDLTGSGTSVDDYLVQPGDWLRLQVPPPGYGPNFQISNIAGKTTATVVNTPPAGTSSICSIIRGARPIAGEPTVPLPNNVAVNIAGVDSYQNSGGVKVYTANQIPVRQFTAGGPKYYEIIFDSSGGVLNRSSAVPMVLWVHDETQPPTNFNTARAIGIQPRGGNIAAHPVSPNTDNPLGFALDGSGSGI